MKLFLLLLSLTLAQATRPPQEGPSNPPAGRPPEGPLLRTNPKKFQVTWEIFLNVAPTTKGEAAPLRLADARFLMPMIPMDTFSRTDLDGARMTLMTDNQVDASAPGRMQLDRDVPGGMVLATMSVSNFAGQSLRCTLIFDGITWRSEIDDAKASQIPWPHEWPAEAQAWLKPQWMIESADPRFSDFVKKVAGDKLRQTTVYVAAKELIRATINAYKGVEGTGIELRPGGLVRGLRMSGAASSMAAGHGTYVDVVCACVATLRAAGIPARPVIGVTEASTDNPGGVRTSYIVWGEFYLPGAGWVPFDPAMLRGSSGMTSQPQKPWKGVGNIKDLNLRVPFAFTFMPPRVEVSNVQYPGVWGWIARGTVTSGTATDYVRFQMTTLPTPQE